jgi:nitroreductase
MEFADVVRRRRMVRSFDARPIPPDTVERLLAYAQRGPSSGFTQGFEFLVFDGPEQTAKFWEHASPTMRQYLSGTVPAPLIIVPFAHEQAYVDRYRQPDKAATHRASGADFPAPYWFIDSAFAAMLVLLGAVDEGLGAFFFSIEANRRGIESFVRRFGVPDGYWPIGAIAVGYPRGDEIRADPGAIKAARRPLGHVLHSGRW